MKDERNNNTRKHNNNFKKILYNKKPNHRYLTTFGHKKILAISYLCCKAIVGVKVLNFCVRDGYR